MLGFQFPALFKPRASLSRVSKSLVRMCTSSASQNKNVVVRARHILVDTAEMASACLEQVQTDRSKFAELAKTLSKCPSGAAKQGDLGWIRPGEMLPEFDAVIFSDEVISQLPEKGSPIPPSSPSSESSFQLAKTDFGFHVVEVTAVRIAAGDMMMDEFVTRYEDVSEREKMQLIDVREQWEVEVAGLDGFLILPMSQYEEWAPDVESGEVVDFDKETVVMCHHGMRSAQMAAYFSQIGFTNVRNLVGGIDQYALKSSQFTKRY
uniref:Peptidyl-prolyl cis-trans isomerase n=1 Tax=Timspurckia oligopyrenoides TaxID=708627 RepID=A0A7S0ZIN7_9RHOD|mmetsp:Transcript_6181/g.11016  ORF Transcript_6181/g.11016 Transcript_6181/m.11016 type:complete len:264 (+) Transcript_6181:142-933(+)